MPNPDRVYHLITDLPTLASCTVTDAQPGQVFAFDVRYLGLRIARWRYDVAGAG
jgi:hypothetical protein